MRFLSSWLGNDRKELKVAGDFSVAIGRGNERMFLVCVSMMLNGDTLQLAGTVEELSQFVPTFCIQWQKRTCFLVTHC